jgi:hypothetical protein
VRAAAGPDATRINALRLFAPCCCSGRAPVKVESALCCASQHVCRPLAVATSVLCSPHTATSHNDLETATWQVRTPPDSPSPQAMRLVRPTSLQNRRLQVSSMEMVQSARPCHTSAWQPPPTHTRGHAPPAGAAAPKHAPLTQPPPHEPCCLPGFRAAPGWRLQGARGAHDRGAPPSVASGNRSIV